MCTVLAGDCAGPGGESLTRGRSEPAEGAVLGEGTRRVQLRTLPCSFGRGARLAGGLEPPDCCTITDWS